MAPKHHCCCLFKKLRCENWLINRSIDRSINARSIGWRVNDLNLPKWSKHTTVTMTLNWFKCSPTANVPGLALKSNSTCSNQAGSSYLVPAKSKVILVDRQPCLRACANRYFAPRVRCWYLLLRPFYWFRSYVVPKDMPTHPIQQSKIFGRWTKVGKSVQCQAEVSFDIGFVLIDWAIHSMIAVPWKCRTPAPQKPEKAFQKQSMTLPMTLMSTLFVSVPSTG